MSPTAPPLRVSVIGAGLASPAEERRARELGRALAEVGAVVVCGGLGGVMAAVARGCREGGGRVVGLLPGREADGANPWIDLPLPTGMGEGRNVLVVRGGEAVVAVGGEWGTLSEIALARKIGRPVLLLGPPCLDGLDLPRSEAPEEAAAWAVEQARKRRGPGD